MEVVLIVIHVILTLSLIGLVLLQRGKGAEAGAAFGAGASGTVFGARGAASFLGRVTTFVTAGFFATSLALASLYASQSRGDSELTKPETTESADAETPSTDSKPEGDTDDVPSTGTNAKPTAGDDTPSTN